MNIKKSRNLDADGGNTNFWKYLIFLGVIAVTFAIWSSFTENEPEVVVPLEKPLIIPSLTASAEGKLPKNFPPNIALNGSVSIFKSYDATYPGLKAQQGTVIFDSTKTPLINISFYEKWAKNNEWEILGSNKQGEVLALYLKKAAEEMSITIKDSRVNISYVNLNE